MSVRVMVVLTVLVGLLALGGGVALANVVGPVGAWPGMAQQDGWLGSAAHGSMHGGDAGHDAMHESMGGADHDAMHETMREAMPADQQGECDAHHAAVHDE